MQQRAAKWWQDASTDDLPAFPVRQFTMISAADIHRRRDQADTETSRSGDAEGRSGAESQWLKQRRNIEPPVVLVFVVPAALCWLNNPDSSTMYSQRRRRNSSMGQRPARNIGRATICRRGHSRERRPAAVHSAGHAAVPSHLPSPVRPSCDETAGRVANPDALPIAAIAAIVAAPVAAAQVLVVRSPVVAVVVRAIAVLAPRRASATPARRSER